MPLRCNLDILLMDRILGCRVLLLSLQYAAALFCTRTLYGSLLLGCILDLERTELLYHAFIHDRSYPNSPL